MSGGLDSGVINILATRELKKIDRNLLLFSWAPSFETFERQERDERAFIDMICRQEDLECLFYNYDDDLKCIDENIDKEMKVDSNSLRVLTQEYKKMSARGVRLMLSGWGGDQGISHRANLFALFINGYWSHLFKEAYSLIIQYLFPFLDYNVVDFSVSIPVHMYYKKGINRYAYRKAFEDILPEELCYYVPKDDIARITYYRDKMNSLDIEKKILEKKLNRELFSKYIDFKKAEKVFAAVYKEDDIRKKIFIRRKLHICM